MKSKHLFPPKSYNLWLWLGFRGEVQQKVWGVNNLFAFANVDYVDVSGKSIGEMKFDTSMQLIPVGFGLKLRQSMGSLASFNLGAGPKYSSVDILNKTSAFTTQFKKESWGGEVSAGIDLLLTKNIFFDLTYEYFYTKFVNNTYQGTISSNDLVISSINLASGLKFSF